MGQPPLDHQHHADAPRARARRARGMRTSESTPLVRERRDGWWTSRRAVAVTLAVTLAATLAATRGDAGRPNELRMASLSGKLSAKSAATLKAYGGKHQADVHVMRWTHETGFV